MLRESARAWTAKVRVDAPNKESDKKECDKESEPAANQSDAVFCSNATKVKTCNSEDLQMLQVNR